MTKKDFQMVADVLKGLLEDGVPSPVVKKAADSFMVMFKKSNPRFDEGRFLKACGLE